MVGTALGAALTLALPGTAAAHAFPNVGDFYAGMLHPMVTLEAILPLLALAMLAGQQGREAAIRVLVALPPALLAGVVWGSAARGAPHLVPVLLAALALLGGLVAGGWALPVPIILTFAAVLGALIGFANGAELAAGESVLRFALGVALTGLLVVAYVIGGVRRLSAPWTRIAVRVAGSWLAATGLMVLALRQ